MQTTLPFFFAILLFSCAPEINLFEAESETNQSIRFKRIAGRIPVISATLNGKPAYFIIDTGASVSVLNEPEAENYGFTVGVSNDINVTGFAGSSNVRRVGNYTLQVGTLKITHIRFSCKNINDLVRAVYQNENIKISGILGSDVFAQYRMQIDFMTQTISF